MNKIIKSLVLVFLGLIIWIGISYIAFSFLLAELNAFVWSKSERGGMLYIIFAYICFIPLMLHSLNKEI